MSDTAPGQPRRFGVVEGGVVLDRWTREPICAATEAHTIPGLRQLVRGEHVDYRLLDEEEVEKIKRELPNLVNEARAILAAQDRQEGP